jgi:hypothetical protein
MFIKSRCDGQSTHGSEQTKASLTPKPIFLLGSAVSKEKHIHRTSTQKNVMAPLITELKHYLPLESEL